MAYIKQDIINNYIYFYHLDVFCILPLYPETVTDSLQTTFQSSTALSRSAPVFTYSNSGPRNIQVTFDLHRDLMNDVNKDNSYFLNDNVIRTDGDDYIDTLVKYIQAISLPKYEVYSGESKSVTPPMVALRLGNEVFIKGIVNSNVQVTYNKPIMSDGKYAKISISFNISEVEPYEARTVIKTGSFRTTAAGFNVDTLESINKANSINSSVASSSSPIMGGNFTKYQSIQ